MSINQRNGKGIYTDHAMKLDTTKEIAMLQRNEKGKEDTDYTKILVQRVKGQSRIFGFVTVGQKCPIAYIGYSKMTDQYPNRSTWRCRRNAQNSL